MTKSKAPKKKPTSKTPFDRLTRDGKLKALRGALVAQQEAAVATSDVARQTAELVGRLHQRVERLSPLLDDLFAVLHLTAMLLAQFRGGPLTVEWVEQLVGRLETEANLDLDEARAKGTAPTTPSGVLIEGVQRALVANRNAAHHAKVAADEAAISATKAAAEAAGCTCSTFEVTGEACPHHGRPTIKLPSDTDYEDHAGEPGFMDLPHVAEPTEADLPMTAEDRKQAARNALGSSDATLAELADPTAEAR